MQVTRVPVNHAETSCSTPPCCHAREHLQAAKLAEKEAKKAKAAAKAAAAAAAANNAGAGNEKKAKSKAEAEAKKVTRCSSSRCWFAPDARASAHSCTRQAKRKINQLSSV
jgi:hypothetical protein